MVERLPFRRRLPALRCTRAPAPMTALGAVLVAVLAGCSDDPAGGKGGGCPSPSAAPPAQTAQLPPGLSFDKIGTVTEVRKDGADLTAKAVSTKPLDELTVLIQDAVTAAGYRPAGMDNEGDEAEVFFSSGSVAAGQARVEKAGCEGTWDIDLTLLDLAAASPTTATPTTT